MNSLTKKLRLIFLVGCCVAMLTGSAAATTITIMNLDSAGEGFNDNTAAAPVGGNAGLTVGQQRLNAFNFAASVWEQILNSNVEIRIGAQFDPLSCSASSGVLGAAGPQSLSRDYAGAPMAGTWYVRAEADMHSGLDLSPGALDIGATFNSMLGTTDCLESLSWYYGLDHNEGASQVNLVVVLLHEFAHGLGFLSLVDETTGKLGGDDFNGRYIDAYSYYLLDNTTGKFWYMMSDAERIASAINTNKLVWAGPSVTDAASDVLCAPFVIEVTNPAVIAGVYEAPLADFGAGCTSQVAGEVVLVNDGSGTPTDACTAIPQDFTNKIALIDRGVCAFTDKVLNAQNAGAIGVIVINNTATEPFTMTGIGTGITIPAVMVSLSNGNLLKGQLGSGLTITIRGDNTRLAGADGSHHVKIYNPSPVEPGSSISHWSTTASPNLLMEPAINSDLFVSVDLTRQAFFDIGWQFFAVAVSQLPELTAARQSDGVMLTWRTHPDLLDRSVYVHREQASGTREQVSPQALPWGATSFWDAAAPTEPVDYWLELVSPQGAVIWQGPLHVDGVQNLTQFSFAPGFPNPFQAQTQLSYALPATGQVRVAVFDLRGRLVRELVNGTEPVGQHSVFWDGRDNRGVRAAAGVYYARVTHEGLTRSQKIVVLK